MMWYSTYYLFDSRAYGFYFQSYAFIGSGIVCGVVFCLFCLEAARDRGFILLPSEFQLGQWMCGSSQEATVKEAKQVIYIKLYSHPLYVQNGSRDGDPQIPACFQGMT